MKRNNFFKLAVALVLPQIAGLIGTLSMGNTIDTWYQTINKSPLNPPDWVFGVVWPVLFTLMGVAAYLVWQEGLKKLNVREGLMLFLVQLSLNAIWSWFYFGLANPLWALYDLAILWVVVAATIFAFAKVSKTAAWLMLPYILWISFAFYLNYQTIVLN